MAELYPFSNRTTVLLRVMPGPGSTHRWLAQVANGLRRVLSADRCFCFLRQCCDQFVTHRPVPDVEIHAAVTFAYADQPRPPINFGRQSVNWPAANPKLIARVLATMAPAFDADRDSGLTAQDVLPAIFRPGELVCAGPTTQAALVRPLEATLPDAHFQQFIVVNPMRERSALNQQGQPSPRCLNNTRARRYLVAEFDDVTLTKTQQAQLLTQLTAFVPLVLVVDSGGKSLHGWFRVDRFDARDQVRFFYVACLLGADKSRWDASGWLRMPAGLRVVAGVPAVHQRILYFNPEAAHV